MIPVRTVTWKSRQLPLKLQKLVDDIDKKIDYTKLLQEAGNSAIEYWKRATVRLYTKRRSMGKPTTGQWSKALKCSTSRKRVTLYITPIYNTHSRTQRRYDIYLTRNTRQSRGKYVPAIDAKIKYGFTRGAMNKPKYDRLAEGVRQKVKEHIKKNMSKYLSEELVKLVW